MKTRGANKPTEVIIRPNDGCPCGSGTKFKDCCMGNPNARFGGGIIWKGIVAIIVLTGIVALVLDLGSGRDASIRQSAVTPEPWFYDAENDQHWHPDHAHWHDGPPPLEQQQSLTQTPIPPSGLTPDPWFYNAANNEHWHPRHAHWHAGLPPQDPNSSAQVLNAEAWDLLSSASTEQRDPAQALPLAQRAVDKSGGTNAGFLDTLALAQHLTGDTASAIETARKALSLLSANTPGRGDYEAALARYEAALDDDAN